MIFVTSDQITHFSQVKYHALFSLPQNSLRLVIFEKVMFGIVLTKCIYYEQSLIVKQAESIDVR